MKKRSVAWCAGVLMSVASLVSAEAAGPLVPRGVLSSSVLGSRAHDLVLNDAGNLAYVATDLGLRIVDIHDPDAPTLHGSLNLGGRSLGIALKGSHVFVAAMGADLKVVNVANPSAPALVASKAIAGNVWDVAIKDDVAYVSTFSGQVYLFDISSLPNLPQIDVLGLPAWSSAGQDATNLAKLSNYITTGNAKVAGVAVAGNNMFAVDWNYGRKYHYDVTDARNPIFRGTHYAPFLLRIEGDADGSAVYSLGAYGGTSGIYSLVIAPLPPSTPPFAAYSTRSATCGAICDYFKSPNTDFGGLTVSSNGRYVVYIAGKGTGEVRVLDVTNPADIQSHPTNDAEPIGAHGSRTGESMGVQTRGDFVYTASGLVGLQIFSYDGLSD